MHFVMSTDYIREMQAMFAAVEAEAPKEEGEIYSVKTIFDRAAIEKNLENCRCGIKLTGFNMLETEDTTAWDMEFTLGDVNKIYELNQALYPEEELAIGEDDMPVDEDEPAVPPIYSRQDDGTWVYTRWLDEVAAANKDESAMYDGDYSAWMDENTIDSEMIYDDSDMVFGETGDIFYDSAMSMMPDDSMGAYMDQFSGMAESMMSYKMRFTVTFPGAISETNASLTEGKKATWEIGFADMNNRAPVMKAVIKK